MTKRILSSYLLITVFVLVVLEVPLGFFFADREVDRQLLDLERDASVLATFYEESIEEGIAPDPTIAVDYSNRTHARVIIVDDQGTSLVDTEREASRDYSTRPEIHEALNGLRATGSRYSETLGTQLNYVAVPIASGGHVLGAIRLTLDRGEVDARIRDFWLGLAAMGVVIVILTGALGWAVATSIGRPLRRLTTTVSRFAAGDLEPGDPVSKAPAEVRELAENMNQMAAQLGASLESQRSFVADASHQLRTPVTALLLRLEALGDIVDDGVADAELDAARRETRRLGSIVDELLGLARAAAPADSEIVDIARLTSDRVDTWTAAAEEQGVILEADISEIAIARVVPGAIEQILDNLIDNAITYGRGGKTVRVSCESTPDAIVVVVTDHGPGLTDDQKASAVERFWRGDTTTSGSGLGLAIVDALVRNSAGTLSLSDTPKTGLTVSVALQRARTSRGTDLTTAVVERRRGPGRQVWDPRRWSRGRRQSTHRPGEHGEPPSTRSG